MRAVCLDFDGTLGYMSPSHWAAYAQAAREHGLEVSEQQLAAAGTDRAWERWATPLGVAHPQASTSEAAFRAVRAAIAVDRLRAAGVDAPPATLRAVGERAADLEGETARYRLYDDARPALERIAAAGARAIVISNHVWRLPEIVRGLGVEPLIAGVITSARCGYRKPHPEIFRAALRVAAAEAAGEAGETVMVGDSMAADVRGAQALGMRAVLLDRSGAAPAPPDVTVIRTLLEVPLAWP